MGAQIQAPQSSSGNVSQVQALTGTPVAGGKFARDVSVRHIENLVETIEGPLYKITRVINGATYVAENKTQRAATTSATWRVRRTYSSGGDTVLEFAGTGAFDQTADNLTALFGAIPFANQYSLNFTNSNKRITVPHHASLSFERTNAFSYGVWTNSDATTNWTLFAKMAFVGSGNRGVHINRNGNNIYFEIMAQDATYGAVIRTVPITQHFDGQWHFWAFTYDGSSLASGMKIYCDGVELSVVVTANTLTAVGSPATIINSANLNMGWYSAGFNHFNGYFDEPCVANSCWSAAEVVAIYNAGKPRDLKANANGYVSAGALVSWWRFREEDRLTIGTVADQAGTNHATTTNVVSGNFVDEVP